MEVVANVDEGSRIHYKTVNWNETIQKFEKNLKQIGFFDEFGIINKKIN